METKVNEIKLSMLGNKDEALLKLLGKNIGLIIDDDGNMSMPDIDDNNANSISTAICLIGQMCANCEDDDMSVHDATKFIDKWIETVTEQLEELSKLSQRLGEQALIIGAFKAAENKVEDYLSQNPSTLSDHYNKKYDTIK